MEPNVFRSLGSASDWKKAALKVAAGEADAKSLDAIGIMKGFAVESAKAIDPANRIIEFCISTAAVDRENDTISVAGWDLANYNRNPVILFAHDHWQPVVGRSLAVWTESNQLRSRAQFTPRELNPLGFMLYQLYAEDYMRATSVGFNPKKWQFVEDSARKFGVDYAEQELLEYSVVPVPANPEALSLAKAKSGIDTSPMKAWAERTLDLMKVEGEREAMAKEHVERIRKMCDPTGRKMVLVLGELKGLGAPAKVEEPEAKKLTPEGSHKMAGEQCERCGILSTEKEIALPCVLREAEAPAPAKAEKAGRVLSKRNEDKLRTAYGSIGEVLSQLEATEEEEDDKALVPPAKSGDEGVKKTEPAAPAEDSQDFFSLEPDPLEKALAELAPGELQAAVQELVQGEITRNTGRLD